MPERVDARDVLDATGTTRRGFTGEVVGYFRRIGPNAWDDYEFVSSERGQFMDVNPGLPIHLEAGRSEVRLRSKGRVVRVRWTPSAKESAQLEDSSLSEQRQYFISEYLSGAEGGPELGASAVIAQKLRG